MNAIQQGRSKHGSTCRIPKEMVFTKESKNISLTLQRQRATAITESQEKIGTIKAGSGFLGYSRIGDIGLNTCLHGPKQLPEYLEPELKDVGVIFDDKGYPIHPDTREYARIIGPKLQLLINTFYFFIWPCILIQDKMIEKKNYLPVSQNEDIELTTDQLAAARTEEESEQMQSMFEDSYGSNEMSTSPSANETLDASARWQGAMGRIVN